MFIHSYPYSDNHEINLDWIIQQTEAMTASNRELIQEVQTSKEVFINQTESFEAALNRQTTAMESLVKSISEYIGIIVDFDPSDMYDIEFLGWAVPRPCPVHNYKTPNGNYHKRIGRLKLNSLDWARYGTNRFYTRIDPAWKLVPTSDIPNIYTYGYNVTYYLNWSNMSLMMGPGGNLFIQNDNYDVTVDFVNSLGEQYIYFELPEEIVYTPGQEALFRNSLASVNSVRLNSEPVSVVTDSFNIEPETVVETDSMVESEPMVEAEPLVEAEPMVEAEP